MSTATAVPEPVVWVRGIEIAPAGGKALDGVDPDSTPGEHPLAVQQQVAVARAKDVGCAGGTVVNDHRPVTVGVDVGEPGRPSAGRAGGRRRARAGGARPAVGQPQRPTTGTPTIRPFRDELRWYAAHHRPAGSW